MGAPDAPGAQAADRDAGPRPIVDHRVGDTWGARRSGQGWPIGQRQATAGDPRRLGPGARGHPAPAPACVAGRAPDPPARSASSRAIRAASRRRSDQPAIGATSMTSQRSTRTAVAPGASSVKRSQQLELEEAAADVGLDVAAEVGMAPAGQRLEAAHEDRAVADVADPAGLVEVAELEVRARLARRASAGRPVAGSADPPSSCTATGPASGSDGRGDRASPPAAAGARSPRAAAG